MFSSVPNCPFHFDRDDFRNSRHKIAVRAYGLQIGQVTRGFPNLPDGRPDKKPPRASTEFALISGTDT